MNVPDLVGVIDRRLLINFRVDADVIARVLPTPLRPQIAAGSAVAGICLLRLEELRPAGVPRWLGQRSENAAHRVAVEWDTPDGVATGVYITRRDSDSLLNVLAGGRVFPGVHHRSRFAVDETEDAISVGFRSRDGSASAQVVARLSADLSDSHLFASVDEASRFFESGCIGYSDGPVPGRLDGMQLVTSAWRVDPLRVESYASSVFDDETQFPRGSVAFDCGLIMRRVPVTWTALEPMPVRATAPVR